MLCTERGWQILRAAAAASPEELILAASAQHFDLHSGGHDVPSLSELSGALSLAFGAYLRETCGEDVLVMNNGVPPESAGPEIARLRWPLVAVIISLLALAGFTYLVYSCKETIVGSLRESGSQSVTNIRAISEEVAKGMERFKKGTITQTFTAAIPSLAHDGGGNLELATAIATETFTRTDRRTIGWDWLSLGTTVTEIKVPA